MDREIVNIIKTAVALEKEEVEYYRKAAARTKNPEGKKVFNYLAEQEEEHLDRLKRHLAVAEGGDGWLPDEDAFNKRVCKTLSRKKPGGIIPKKPKENATDLDALRQAIEIEKKSMEFYTGAACKARDKKALKVLHYLVEAEREHLKELEIQYAFLESEGFWYDNEIAPT